MKDHKIRVGLGSDVGGGTAFSLLKTMDEAYKVTDNLLLCMWVKYKGASHTSVGFPAARSGASP